jgi:hypothetical protein
VHGAGPAKGEQGVGARVLAALDGVDPRRVRHVLVDDLVDAPDGLDGIETERACDLLLRPQGVVAVELHLPAEEEVGVEVAQDQVRVGRRGLFAAAAVAGRPWV